MNYNIKTDNYYKSFTSFYQKLSVFFQFVVKFKTTKLPKDHLARYIVSIVDQLDLSSICNKYSSKGRRGINPSILLSLLFYGYVTGVFSSRKIERATYDSVAFRFIFANTHPDHDTIAHFRKEFLKELPSLFLSILVVVHISEYSDSNVGVQLNKLPY